MAYPVDRLANGDTKCELLARSRYLLMMSRDKWSDSHKERARILFDLYPDIKEAYNLVHSLRCIFNSNTTKEKAYLSMLDWFNQVKDFGNDAFNVAATEDVN
jgi:Na+/phosphate symporter